jgi:hypothetical protein
MRNVLFAVLFSALARGQGAPPQGGVDQPYSVEYYYKVQWGHQQEFLQLFLKNHYPLLQKIVESGRMLSVKTRHPHITPPKTDAGIIALRSASRTRRLPPVPILMKSG